MWEYKWAPFAGAARVGAARLREAVEDGLARLAAPLAGLTAAVAVTEPGEAWGIFGT